MALPDIKDAGILATFDLWGWPWHGLCTSGVIAAAGGHTKTITPPAHGSAWLIDRALPALTRTTAELAADAALGHEWRNYGMVSGGSVYGTQLGSDSFIHVDADGVRWLVSLAYSFPNLASQQVRITLSIVQFGLFGEGIKTPISVVKDVQCNFINYTAYGYSYNTTRGLLEDVWTNGARFLVSVGRARITTAPLIHDIFSLIEFTVSGSGGADGSGLVFTPVEIMKDTDLSQGLPTSDVPSTIPTVTGAWSYVVAGSVYTMNWDTPGVYWEPGGEWVIDNYDTYTYARYAYYNSAGQAKAARIKKQYSAPVQFVSSSTPTGGGEISLRTGACNPGIDEWTTDAVLYETTVCVKKYAFGIYLLENDTVIDSLELYQEAQVSVDYAIHQTAAGGSFVYDGHTVTCDLFDVAGSPWGSLGHYVGAAKLYSKAPVITWGAAQWRGSLASSLSLPTPPDLSLSEWSRTSLPLSVDAVIDIWRDSSNDHETSGSATVTGTTDLGIQRIDAKSAAFYIPGASRAYGSVLTPLGSKTTSLTPAGNLYFAWQRKTGDFAFDASSICYV